MSGSATGSGLGGSTSSAARAGSTTGRVAGGVDTGAATARLPNGGAGILGRLVAGTLPVHPHTDELTGGVIDYLRTSWGTDHLAAPDAHPGYLTTAEGDLRYLPLEYVPPPSGISQADADLRYLQLTGGALSGNLGLGVAPDPWAYFKGVQIGGAGSALMGGAGPETYLLNNAHYNGAEWRASSALDAIRVGFYAGAMTIATAPAGAAGRAVDFATRLHLRGDGVLTLSGTNPSLSVDAPADHFRAWRWKTSGSERWALQVYGTETGSNAGSDLTLPRFSDAGGYLGDALSISRATGAVTTGGPVTAGGILTLAGGGANNAITSSSGNLYLRTAPGAFNLQLEPSGGYFHAGGNGTVTSGHPSLQWANGHYMALTVASKPVAVSPDASNALEWRANGFYSPAAASPAFVGARARRTTTQTIPDNTLTLVSFDAESYDTDAFHDLSTTPTRVTVPSGQGGYYRIGASVDWAADANGALVAALLQLNGTTELARSQLSGAACTGAVGGQLGTEYYLAAGDYLELAVFQWQSPAGTRVLSAGTPGTPALWLSRLGT